MSNKNNNEEIAELSFLAGKGNYIKEIFYIEESDKTVKFGREKDNKSLWIPKSLIKGGWKKEVGVIHNIFIKDFITHLELKWQDE